MRLSDFEKDKVKDKVEITKQQQAEIQTVFDSKITPHENHILFEFDQTIVVSRLIDGEYFRIDQMLSSDYETKIKINKKEFFFIFISCVLIIDNHLKNLSTLQL